MLKDLDQNTTIDPSRLSDMLKVANIGFWKIHHNNGELEFSDEFFSVLEMPVHPMKIADYLKLVDPKDLDVVKSIFTPTQNNDLPENSIHRICMPDGTTKYIEVRFIDPSSGIVQDITDRISNELELEKNLQKYRYAIQNLNEQKFALDEHAIVSITDKNGKITYVNEKFLDISGYESHELLGKNHSILSSGKHDKEFWQNMYKQISSGKPWNAEVCNRSKDGSLFWFETTIVPFMHQNNKIKSIISIRTDITERINSAQTIRERDIKLMQQSRLAQMGEMISMIAHQWRQPLSAISATAIDIKMQIELDAEEFNKKDKRKEFLEDTKHSLADIESFVQNLTNTIDDFRTFYKPQKESNLASINEPIRKALHIVRGAFEASSIHIELNLQSTQETPMHINEMMQVFLNLLKNSQDNFLDRKHNGSTINIYTYDNDKEIVVEFYDNGGGIKKDIIKHVFEPYYSTKSAKNGTGLGLYMSKTIVEEHHKGSIDVKNTDTGCCFKIIIAAQ